MRMKNLASYFLIERNLFIRLTSISYLSPLTKIMSIKHYQLTQAQHRFPGKDKPNEIKDGVLNRLLAKYQPHKGLSRSNNSIEEKIEKIIA